MPVYQGCGQIEAQNAGTLDVYVYQEDTSVTTCGRYCASENFTYAALQGEPGRIKYLEETWFNELNGSSKREKYTFDLR